MKYTRAKYFINFLRNSNFYRIPGKNRYEYSISMGNILCVTTVTLEELDGSDNPTGLIAAKMQKAHNELNDFMTERYFGLKEANH